MKFRKFYFKALLFLLFLFPLFFKIAPKTIIDHKNYNAYEIYDKNNNLTAILQNDHNISTLTFEEIPKKFIEILLFLEDKSFYKHSGFDIYRIGKTIFTNLFNNERYGASTITQQYIKNVYLSNNKNLIRKIKEIILSISLEKNTNKNEILTAYLATIYLGNGQYGIKNAATFYFNKTLSQLSINEIILLCTILRAPNYYNPLSNINTCLKKKDELLKHLRKNNIISEYEFSTSYNYKYILKLNEEALNKSYFIDLVKNELKRHHNEFDFEEKIKVYTSYNPLFEHINPNNINGDIAVIIADNNNNLEYILGGASYKKNNYNIAYLGKRDIGSTIKPLLYYEALKCGYNIDKKYVSKPLTITYNDVNYTFNNYGNIYPKMPINMRYALATSDNIYAVKTHLDLGMKTLANHLKLYGIEALSIPSLALGSVSMSLSKLVEIYSCINNNGWYQRLNIINYLEHKGTKKAIINSKTKLLDEKYTKILKELMKGMFDTTIAENVTGRNMTAKLKTTFMGKSGLTDYDSYMIGFNNSYIIGCWSGYIDNKKLTNQELKATPKKLFIDYANLTTTNI